MKDIKITEQNYKELFECAGFEEKSDMNEWSKESDQSVAGEWGVLKLAPIARGEHFSILAKFCHDGYFIPLGSEVTSTAELDRIFYPFLDDPLVWEKKWDFESVFERVWGDAVQRNEFRSSYINQNPRVQAFSRLLLVMNELNKEYEGSGVLVSEIVLEGGNSLSISPDNSCLVIEGCWVFNSSVAASLFLRDNEADLKTFFNI